MEPTLQVFPRTWLTDGEDSMPFQLTDDPIPSTPTKSMWVHLLARITPAYTSPAASREEWHQYRAEVLGRAAVVSFALFIAALLVIVKTGCSVSVLQLSKAQVRARWRWHLCVAFLGLLLALATAAVYGLLSGEGSSDAIAVANSMWAGVADCLKQVSFISYYVSTTTTRLDISLRDAETVPGCPQDFLTAMKKLVELETACASHTARLDAHFQDMSSFVSGAKDFLGGAFSKAAITVYLSSAAVSVGLIAVIVSLFRLRPAESSTDEGQDAVLPSLGMCWAPCVVAPMILVLSFAAGCGTTLLMTTSSICQDPDAATVAFSKKYRRVDDIISSYIMGSGNNWILFDMNRVEETLDKVRTKISIIDVEVRESCNAIDVLSNTDARTIDSQGAIGRMQAEMSREQLQAAYTHVVYSDLCRSMIDGLAWWVLLQLLLGAGLLPLLAGLLHQQFVLPSDQSEESKDALEMSQSLGGFSKL